MITTKDRFVFSINTAEKLPCFLFINDDPWLNPYSSIILTNKEVLSAGKNLKGIYMTNKTLKNNLGICNFNLFKERLNIFMNGYSGYDLLTGLDWTHFGITGSIMTACLPKHNPLMDNFNFSPEDLSIDNLFKF